MPHFFILVSKSYMVKTNLRGNRIRFGNMLCILYKCLNKEIISKRKKILHHCDSVCVSGFMPQNFAVLKEHQIIAALADYFRVVGDD